MVAGKLEELDDIFCSANELCFRTPCRDYLRLSRVIALLMV